jgi:cyanophycin synthetase
MSLRTTPARSANFAGTRKTASALVEMAAPLIDAEQAGFLRSELERYEIEVAGPDQDQGPVGTFFACLIAAHYKLLVEARYYYPEPVELVSLEGEKPKALLAIPKIALQGGMAVEVFSNLARMFGRAATSKEPIDRALESVRARLAEAPRPGPNNYHFVRAADELGLPLLEWRTGHLQFGYGARSCVLNGSITHETPSTGVHLARDKSLCNSILAQAGFPVANGAVVNDFAGAVQLAEQLGYPVVLKPANLDGGKAVSSDIRSLEELKEAWSPAYSASPKIIVEKHIAGNDHRLLFFRGELLVGIERTPGGVTGNGKDSVRALVDELNSDPDRGPGPETMRYPVEFNDEARLMLRREGLTPDHVPADGEFIQLRRAANFALGGNVRFLEDGDIHPDNLDLAIRAIRLLRLDLAGIDLIMPDIAKSWRETGAAICEINAQPFIGDPIRQDYEKMILEQLVPETERIPVVLFVGTLDQKLRKSLEKQVPGLAVVDKDGAQIGSHPASLPEVTWQQACQAPLFNSTVEALLCVLDPAELNGPLSPVDRFAAAFMEAEAAPDSALLSLLRRAGAVKSLRASHKAVLDDAGIASRKITDKTLEKELLSAFGGKAKPAAKKAQKTGS